MECHIKICFLYHSGRKKVENEARSSPMFTGGSNVDIMYRYCNGTLVARATSQKQGRCRIILKSKY